MLSLLVSARFHFWPLHAFSSGSACFLSYTERFHAYALLVLLLCFSYAIIIKARSCFLFWPGVCFLFCQCYFLVCQCMLSFLPVHVFYSGQCMLSFLASACFHFWQCMLSLLASACFHIWQCMLSLLASACFHFWQCMLSLLASACFHFWQCMLSLLVSACFHFWSVSAFTSGHCMLSLLAVHAFSPTQNALTHKPYLFYHYVLIMSSLSLNWCE